MIMFGLFIRVTRLGKILPFGQFFMALGKFFSRKCLGKILPMKKLPKIDLNKAKILFQKRFFTCFSKIFKKIYLLFYVKKTIKECPVPLDISIKSNRNTIKQFYIVNLTKTWLGNFLGDFSLSLGDFFTKTSGHPGGMSIHT
jgi:hypothetical protein